MTIRPDPAEVKSCCSTAYGSDAIELLLGASYHPGGLRLSRTLADRLAVTSDDRLLDVASGRGTTALMVSREYQSTVVGVDLSEANVAHARAQAQPLDVEPRDVAPPPEFRHGDAEALPVGDGEFDVVVSECAFCTFPDKPGAAAEFARALRSGGRLGLTDMTTDPSTLPPELTGLAAWVACIADARPAAEYRAILESAGLVVTSTTEHSETLATMIDRIEARLTVARMAMPEQVAQLGITPTAAKSVITAARQAVADGTLGYSMILAEKP